MNHKLIEELEDKIFRLSVLMLGNFDDAGDATQDILIKVITKIGTLNDPGKLAPWAMQIARNHLINVVKEDMRFKFISLEVMEQDCNLPMEQVRDETVGTEEQNRLLAELKVSCSQAMLMCLSKEERLIYVLSAMFDVNSVDGAAIMDITPEAFRQKLSRGKSRLKNFLQKNCGLVNQLATCNCRKRLAHALNLGRISKEQPEYTASSCLPNTFDIHEFTVTMEHFDDFNDLFRTNPQYILPEERKTVIAKLISENNSVFLG